MNVDVVDVVIVGGGIAGLAAAYELHSRGKSFVILERAPRTGGVIISETVGSFVVDGGPDALLTQKPEGIALCEELGIASRLVPTKLPRLAYIQRGGRLHALPANSVLGIPTRFGPFIRTGLFTWAGKMRMAAEMFVPPRKDDGDESIGSFMRRRFGDEAVDYLAEPLLAGIHAASIGCRSARCFRGSLPPSAIQEPASRSGASVSRHPLTACSDRFQRHERTRRRGDSRAAAGVDPARRGGPALVPNAGPERAQRVEGADGRVYSGKAIILTSTAYVTADLLAPLDPELARLCREIPYASSATIALAFPRAAVAHPLNGSGFVVPRVEKTGIMAASWLSSKWPHRAPDGQVLMRAFVGGARDPGALDKRDDELVALALSALRPLLGITGDPLLTRVYRFERKSAQHDVGHLDRMAAIDKALSSHPGLYVTGSGFRGVGIPTASPTPAPARKVFRSVSGN
jgi:oxygen-dependent protoporphyrinogen oxidase